MILTNVHGLPDPVVRALTYDGYDRVGDVSVTELLKPPQMAYLQSQHDAEIAEDVSERIWQLWGSAAHEVLYRATNKDAVIAEKRLTMELAGWTVAGKADIYDTETQEITDYKTASVWSVVFEPAGRVEHHQQLNLYRVLFEANGYPIKSLRLIHILRDWNRKDSLNRSNYPRIPIHVLNVPLWPQEEAEAFLARRVMLHQAAREEGRYDGCTDAERWINAKGDYPRCETYCNVSSWCDQYRREPRR